jgi:hypothetical protein
MAILETGDDGGLYVPPEVLGDFQPHTPFEVESSGREVILRAVDAGRAFWERSTPAERVKAILEWAEAERPCAPDLSDEMLRRENLYD